MKLASYYKGTGQKLKSKMHDDSLKATRYYWK